MGVADLLITKLLGLTLASCAACSTAQFTRTTGPVTGPAPKPEGELTEVRAEPDPTKPKRPAEAGPAVGVGDPHSICVTTGTIEDRRLCDALTAAPAFDEACEATAAELTVGPRPDLRILRVACAYGEELWTEAHAVVLLRVHEGGSSTLWTGREIYQSERQSCSFVEAVSFRLGDHELLIDTVTSVTRIGEDSLPCEARESRLTTSVALD